MRGLQRHILPTAISIACTLALGFAQEITGSINGVVRDNTGGVLPATQLTVSNLDTGYEARTESDETGSYTFPLLRPGRYRVTAEKTGFQKLLRENVIVNTSERL